MKLLFCSDISFRDSIIDADRAREILSEVTPLCQDVDFRIANCETVLAIKEECDPIEKSGPNLISDPANISFFEELQTDVAVLANNHIGDYGDKGLRDTIKLLSDHNIRHVGAGENLTEAYTACVLEKDGVKISLLAVCENEFGIATEERLGTAGFRIGLLHNRIIEEKQKSDYVIVIFHGGNEFNPMPSPKVKERYRLLCDIGADAVIAMHTHCPQGNEIYKEKPIVYSMGNFYFRSGEERPANNYWYYGYMSLLTIENKHISLEIIPYRFDPEVTKITVFEGKEKQKMLEYIGRLSEYIKDEALVRNYFTGWAYLHPWTPIQIVTMRDREEAQISYAGQYDLASCEAHNEQMIEAYRIMFVRELDKGQEWAEKVTKLQEMPV